MFVDRLFEKVYQFVAKRNVELCPLLMYACLIFCKPNELSQEKINALKEKMPANEYYFCCPNAFGDTTALSLNIYDIDSFSRIQRLVESIG